MSHPKVVPSAKVYMSGLCGEFTIIKRVSSRQVTVKFKNTGSEIVTTSSQIGTGEVRDPMAPLVYGVGFLGVGKHSFNGDKIASNRWRGMLERCYSAKCQKKHPTYKGCTVSKEWHNFQNFADWFSLNYVDGMELDKDIKIDGNKIYSPETCLFVTKRDNLIKATKGKGKLQRMKNDNQNTI